MRARNITVLSKLLKRCCLLLNESAFIQIISLLQMVIIGYSEMYEPGTERFLISVWDIDLYQL
jgi:hypothetical protein